MDSISNSELLELILIQRANLDLQFQFWLTVTFALVAAIFVAGDRLLLKLKIFTCVLYLLATATLVARYLIEGLEILTLLDEAVSREILESRPAYALWLRTTTVAVGSIGAIAFLFFGKQSSMRRSA